MRLKPELILATIATPVLLGADSPQGQVYVAALSGLAESNAARPDGGTGDPDGAGRVKIMIDAQRKRICYDFDLTGVATPMMAHIHRAPALDNGPTVVTLFTGSDGDLQDCIVWTPKQLAAIVDDPAGHYVNLYTTEFPDGALRGQLG